MLLPPVPLPAVKSPPCSMNCRHHDHPSLSALSYQAALAAQQGWSSQACVLCMSNHHLRNDTVEGASLESKTLRHVKHTSISDVL